MKIENHKSVKLASLDIGDCFECDGYLYTIVDDGNLSINQFDHNTLVFRLEDNKLLEYDPNTMIKRVNLKVVVE